MTAAGPAAPAPRVLLVDDNRGFRNELRLLLEDCGIEVVAEGENGQEAVELATRTDAYAYLVKGCSGGLVLDTIEQAWASRSGRASPS